MKYYVMASVNGNVSIISEWNDLNGARVAYHSTLMAYWNAPDIIIGYVTIVDSELKSVQGYRECVMHSETVSE